MSSAYARLSGTTSHSCRWQLLCGVIRIEILHVEDGFSFEPHEDRHVEDADAFFAPPSQQHSVRGTAGDAAADMDRWIEGARASLWRL